MINSLFDIFFVICILCLLFYYLSSSRKRKAFEFIMVSLGLSSLFFFVISMAIGTSFVLTPSIFITGIVVGLFVPGFSTLYSEYSRKLSNNKNLYSLTHSPAVVLENNGGGFYKIKIYRGEVQNEYDAYSETSDIDVGTAVSVYYSKDEHRFFINETMG